MVGSYVWKSSRQINVTVPTAPRRSKPDVLDGLITPDHRYLVVRGRLWRATNPALGIADRSKWTRSLMDARRAVGRALRLEDTEAERRARQRVQRSKVALGERGPVWWDDGAADFTRRLVGNTPYAEWYRRARRSADAITRLLDARPPHATICPSEGARAASPRGWRSELDAVRDIARHLARHDLLVITQRGRALDPDEPFRGAIRLGRE